MHQRNPLVFCQDPSVRIISKLSNIVLLKQIQVYLPTIQSPVPYSWKLGETYWKASPHHFSQDIVSQWANKQYCLRCTLSDSKLHSKIKWEFFIYSWKCHICVLMKLNICVQCILIIPMPHSPPKSPQSLSLIMSPSQLHVLLLHLSILSR